MCNGGDSSCSLRAVVRIEAREDLEIEKLVSRLKSELSLLLVNFMITPDHIKIDISGMEQVSRRRLLANGISNAAAAASARPLERSALQEGWLEVDVPFVVDPPDYKSKLEPPMIGEAAAFLSNLTIEKLNTKPLDGVRIVGAVQVDVTGICGNSICEFGEMTMPGGQPGSCPQDCPALEGTGAQLLPVRSHNRTGNGTEYNVCPDVAEVCDGNDADACYQATVAGTTPQCLGLDVSYSLDYEVPPLNPGTIAPRTIAPRIIAPCPTDNDGNCCAAPAQLDALRRCCQDVHGVDDCGVCGGRGITCAVTVLLQVAAPQTLEVKAFVEYVQDAVVDVLDIYGNEETGPQGTQFTVSVGVNHMVRLPKQTGCAGMLDGKVLPSGVAAFAGQAANGTEDPECRFGNEWLRLEFPVSILPANTEKALPAPSRQQVRSAPAWSSCPLIVCPLAVWLYKPLSTLAVGSLALPCARQSRHGSLMLTSPRPRVQVTSALGRAIDGGEEIYNLVFLSILGSNVTGVCGNRVCETGEMANPYKGTPGTCPGDCRADDGFSAKCPTPTASDVAALSVACGARGTCDESTGACTCWRGYVGPDCSRCGEGYAPFDGECLKEPSLEPVLLDPTVPVSALQAPEGKQDPWTLVLFVGVASGACLLVACLVVAFLLWRRSLARQPAKHLSKANAYPPMGVESIVATNGFTNFSMEHAGALEEVKKGPEGNSPDPARYAEIQRGQLEQGEQRLSRPVNIHEVSFDVSDLAGDAERGDAEIMAAGPHTSQAAAEAQGPKPRSAPELDHSVSFPPPRISRLG